MLTEILTTGIIATSPFGLMVSPGKAGPMHSGQYTIMRVYDLGSKPLQIQVTANEIVRGTDNVCRFSDKPVPWAQISPTSFSLNPGKHHAVRVTITDGASPGKHDLAIVATNALTTGHVRIVAGVAESILVQAPGAGPTTKPCIVLNTAPVHPVPVWLYLGAASLLAALVLGLVLGLRKRHHTREDEDHA